MSKQGNPVYKPLYARIRGALLQRLVSGEWPPGTLLPSETALAAEYDVSQGTLRKALDELATEHLVVRQQGRGTVVARHDSERALFRFFHIHGNDGRRRLPDSKVLGVERAIANREEAAALELEARNRVLRIKRVRYLGDQPAMVETLSLPKALFPDLGEEGDEPLPNALYALYQRRYGVTVAHASEQLRAVAADPRDAEQLGIEPGTPLLEIRRIARDLRNHPVELRRSRLDTRQHYYLNELD